MPPTPMSSQPRHPALLPLLVLALASALAPARAAAQDSTGVPDFWIGLETGGGLASAICANCGESGAQAGTAGNVFLGFGLSRQLLLGLQASAWVDHGGLYSQREDKITRGHLMLIGYYYPWQDVAVFTKFGVGLSAFNAFNRYEPSLKGPNGEVLSSTVHSDGPGVLLAAGYEVFLSSRFALVPSLSYFYGRHAELTFDTTHHLADHATLHLVELNLGIMFHAAR